MQNDFEFTDDLFCKLVDKEKLRGKTSLTPAEQIVVLIWGASGIIENGGFQYFFEHEIDAESVARAYARIGCLKCAELLRLGLSLFPAALLQASWTERANFLEQNSDMFDKLNTAFWKADRSTQKKLVKFIRKEVV